MYKMYVQTHVETLQPVAWPKMVAMVQTFEQGVDLVNSLCPTGGDEGPATFWLEDENGTHYGFWEPSYVEEGEPTWIRS
jgi:hypothetical protein